MTDQEIRDWQQWWDERHPDARDSAQTEEVIETLTAAGPIPAQSEARGARE